MDSGQRGLLQRRAYTHRQLGNYNIQAAFGDSKAFRFVVVGASPPFLDRLSS
jgi:hypothetical protein